MDLFTLIFLAALLNLGALVCYPDTGPLGNTLVYIFILLWSAAGFFVSRYTSAAGRGWKAVIVLLYMFCCAVSVLSFLPQKDAVSPLDKIWYGNYPTRRSLYFGLLRVGVEYPALLAPRTEAPRP